MNKKSNKNSLHNSCQVNGYGHLVDQDYKLEYQVITFLRRRVRRHRRKIVEQFGVNTKVNMVNSNNDDLDLCCQWCKGYGSYDL